jgi:hypothetical protein
VGDIDVGDEGKLWRLSLCLVWTRRCENVWGRRGRAARILCLSTVTKPAEKAPVTYWIGFRVGPGTSLDALDNTKLSYVCRESNSWSSRRPGVA